ncbi:MAG: LytTR family DNA-binding domain-containing protein [Bacteroidales bacterium]|nr:LytTR family DNA-binding domain-containing protein [Bacteroidales bacterium]MCF8388601.1 LytTR family DNA-binding domain-containing protein [Bacteroidales bacterium]MCF8398738.1 LytTR family DNA-binding domain-containing protein [Bacteroidales bacterium]
MIKAIIVEDELKSREALRGLIERYCKNVEIIQEADGYHAGIKVLHENDVDVLFLDIQMPDGSGFKLLEELGEISFEIIFTTAYDQFAIKAIKYSALDYLLKPIVPEELISAVEKVEQKKEKGNLNKNVNVLLNNIKDNKDEPRKIILSTSEKIHVVNIDEIIRCESDNYYTRFFFTDDTRLLISKTLKENEELLREHNFIRPHKSHLINISYIKSFNRSEGGYIYMTDGSKIPVSRRKRESVIDIINHL